MLTYEIRGVLGGCYRGKSVSDRLLLSHVVLTGDGSSEAVLCDRLPVENLSDLTETGPPSCPVCARKLENLLKKGSAL
jgi:tRNA(Ile2) C34 agmatinyltransferase TiaS